MHTAQHLVSGCLSGDLVRDRTIILVTHHITLCLPISSYLVELSQGAVLRHGSIESLREMGLLQKAIEAEDTAPTAIKEEEEAISGPENEADKLLKDPHPGPLKSGKLIAAEARAEGRVSLRTYLTYIRAAGSLSWLLTLILMLAIRLINILAQVRSI